MTSEGAGLDATPPPSIQPEQPHPATPNPPRTVIPTGADRLFSSAFASCERVGLRSGGISLRLRTCPERLEYSRRTVIPTRAHHPPQRQRCPHRHSDRSRLDLFFRVRFLRTSVCSGGISLRFRTCPKRLEHSLRTVIPTGAHHPPQRQRCPHRHSDRSRPTFFFRVRFLRTRRSA